MRQRPCRGAASARGGGGGCQCLHARAPLWSTHPCQGAGRPAHAVAARIGPPARDWSGPSHATRRPPGHAPHQCQWRTEPCGGGASSPSSQLMVHTCTKRPAKHDATLLAAGARVNEHRHGCWRPSTLRRSCVLVHSGLGLPGARKADIPSMVGALVSPSIPQKELQGREDTFLERKEGSHPWTPLAATPHLHA